MESFNTFYQKQLHKLLVRAEAHKDTQTAEFL